MFLFLNKIIINLVNSIVFSRLSANFQIQVLFVVQHIRKFFALHNFHIYH